MATINGFTAERMLEIEGSTVVDGDVVDTGTEKRLILVTRNGTPIDAGPLPPGPQGVPGSISVSPAGGALQGNYPNPGIAAGVVNNSHIASENKDGAVDMYSMRTLGTGPLQAAPGNHSHAGLTDSGWTAFTPVAGEAPFASASVVTAEYRKIGKLVHLRLIKLSTAARDLSGVTSDNFPNVQIIGVGSVPLVARPSRAEVIAFGRMTDAYAGVALNTNGSLIWYGGAGRNYPSGSRFATDIMYFTDN